MDERILQEMEGDGLEYFSRAFIRWPWLNPRTMRAEHGVLCRECSRRWASDTFRDILSMSLPDNRRSTWKSLPAGTRTLFHELPIWSESGVNSFQNHWETCLASQKLLE